MGSVFSPIMISEYFLNGFWAQSMDGSGLDLNQRKERGDAVVVVALWQDIIAIRFQSLTDK